MNRLVVPPSPNWYQVKILACASDNTLIYGSKNDLVILYPTLNERDLQIKFLDEAHGQKVVSVDVNIQWGSPNKWVVSSGDDCLVKLWDIEKFIGISSHDAHKVNTQERKEKLIGASFLTEDRILSVSESGTMYIWHPSTKQYTKLNNFFLSKVSVTCFSPCPHATYIAAFGLKNGLVVVANLKKNGSLMYKLRGHTSDLVSLSWCPAPINIFPSTPNNYIKGTISKRGDSALPLTNGNLQVLNKIEENKDCKNIISLEATENINSNNVLINTSLIEPKENSEEHITLETEVINSKVELPNENPEETEIVPENKKANPWVNLKFPDDDDEVETAENTGKREEETSIYDFITECDLLKKKIAGTFTDCLPLIQKSESGDDLKKESENDESNLKEISCFISNSADEKCKTDDALKGNEKSIDTNFSAMEGLENEKINLEVALSSVSDVEKERSLQKGGTSDIKDKALKDIETEDVCLIGAAPEIERNTLNHKTDNILTEIEERNSSELSDKQNATTNNVDGQGASEESCTTILSKSLEEEPRTEFLLASSGKDSTIYIWRAGTDGRMQCFFRLPEKKATQRRGRKMNDSAWTVVKWITPFTLLTASPKGELFKYTLPKSLDLKKDYSVVHNDHTSFVFSIAAHTPILTAENWLSDLETSFWTFGHDMYLLNTVLDSKTSHLVSLETFCALIYCFAQSPLDPSRICMGLSSGNIKIWNTNDPQVNSFSAVNYSLKIHGKITCLAWHPTNELLVAFSTEEGTIGLLNVNNLNRATWFKQSFPKTVSKIEWGPCSNNNEKTCLYATGGGVVMYFDPDNTKEEPLKIELPRDSSTYTFAWKLDKSLMLLVEQSGKIIFFNNDFSIKATYYQQKKVSLVVWHPDSEGNLDESSPKSYWVAAALNNVVYIFDFAEVSHKSGMLDIQDVTKTTFEKHLGNIRGLAWSPFNGDRLVTAGEDGIAYVWDVPTEQVIASYYGRNFEPIKSVIWSPVNEDILICSVVNASLVVWNISDYTAPINEDILAKCKLRLTSEKKNNLPKEDDSGDNAMKKIKKAIKNTILPTLTDGNSDSAQEKVKLLQELLEWKESGNDVRTNGIPSIKQLFGSKDVVLKLLSLNEMSHLDRGRYEAASRVSLWKGDLQNSIKEAIDHHRVTPLLISLAPTISLSFWQKACETYAAQLAEKTDSDPLEIATYYLACQNIEKAIDSLCEREMFKEALSLAKCRLPENNIFVENILQKWASFSSYCGALETAAQCFIALGKYEEAVKALFRRSELDILKFALKLAKKTDNNELVKAVEFRCKAFEGGDSSNNVEVILPDKKNIAFDNSNSTGNIDKEETVKGDQDTKEDFCILNKDEQAVECFPSEQNKKMEENIQHEINGNEVQENGTENKTVELRLDNNFGTVETSGKVVNEI